MYHAHARLQLLPLARRLVRLQEALAELRRREQDVEVQRRRLARVGIGGELVGEQERAPREAAPDEDFAAVEEGEEDASAEEPGVVRRLRAQRAFERGHVTPPHRLRRRRKFLHYACRLGAAHEGARWVAAEDQVGGDEVDEDVAALVDALRMALGVGGLEAQLGFVEVGVGEEEAAEVVEVGDAVAGGIEGQGRGVLHDVCEELLGEGCFMTLDRMSDGRWGREDWGLLGRGASAPDSQRNRCRLSCPQACHL